MTHDELLAEINYNLDNEVWLHNLGEALRAVVELHKPNHSQYQGVVCSHCTAYEYPCPTIQAIESALD